MKKLIIILLITSLMPLFLLSMEEQAEVISSYEQLETAHEIDNVCWTSLPNEMKERILLFVIQDVFNALEEYSDDYKMDSCDQKLIGILKPWVKLKLIDKNIYELVCNNKKFIFIGELIKFWQSKLEKGLDHFCFLNQAGSLKLLWILQLGFDRKSAANSDILVFSSRNCFIDYCRELIEKGVTIRPKIKIEGLYKAICLHEYNIIKSMLNDNNEAKGNMRLLEWATQFGNLDVIKLVLESTGIEVSDIEQWSPLIVASKWGQLEVIELLINHGASVNEATYIGTPLTFAIVFDHIEVVKLLLEKGAFTDERIYPGITALMIAAGMGQIEIMKLLLEKSAKINLKDNQEKTALMHAAENNRVDAVKLLLSQNPRYVNKALQNLIKASSSEALIDKNQLQIIDLLEEHLEKNGYQEDEIIEDDEIPRNNKCLLC